MRAAFRSVLRVNRAALVGPALVVALATALLSATGAWMQAGWSAEGASGPLVTLASSFAGTTLIIAVFMVGSSFATALRGRRREFAVLRAVGATVSQLRQQVTMEVLVVTLLAAPVGALLGALIAPTLTPLLVTNDIVPAGFALPASPLSIVITLAVLLPSALIAARLAARESAKLSPIAAVRQSAVEPSTTSRGRRLSARIVAAAGLAAAAAPLFLSGLGGTLAGTSSVLLLIVAAALAGPGVVAWLARRGARAASSAPASPAALVLAALAARGFSRRNTAVILPLALLLCLGAVQSGVGAATSAATARQLERSVSADLVVLAAPDAAGPDLEDVRALPGVTAAAHTATVPASVRVEDPDEDGMSFLDELSWETAAVRTLAPAGSGVIDPRVVAGTLDDLDEPGTIAVSRDALLFTGKRVGDPVDLRLDGGPTSAARIVAIYEDALGVGEFLLGGEAALGAAEGVVLVQTEPGSAEAVRAALEADGATVTSVHEYAERAGRASDAEQALSMTLLLALLAFIAVAAVQTLATTTSGRRSEFELLRRTGARSSQLTAMVAVESVFVGVAALLLGAAAALPALLGLGVGLLGDPFAAVSPVVFGGLALVVIVLPILTMAGMGGRLARSVGTGRAPA